MCDPLSATIAGAAILGAGSSYASGKKQAKAQTAAQQSNERMAAAEAQRAEQQFNRANQKQPGIAALWNSNKRGAGRGLGSTFLTGSSGIKNPPLGGAPSLLGG